MNFCVKRLINEVESRPAIWDSRTKDYSDRALKRVAWEEICASFVPNYYESSAGERNGIVSTMQRRWKSVRDAFLRELKKSNAKPQVGMRFTKPYAYYDYLLFLKPVCETRPRRDDDDIILPYNETVTVEYDNDDSDNNDNNSRSSGNFNESKADSVEPTLKRKQPEEREEIVFNMLADHIKYKRKKDTHEDPDRQFLLSLLPDMKDIDQSMKFNLKYDIMCVIKRYKDEHFKIVSTYHQE